MHTAIRPVGGAVIAVTTLGDASPTTEALVGLLGGTLAAGSHFTKSGTRALANTSPEPFSNWILSLGEDVFVVGLGFIALKYPVVAAAGRRGVAGLDRDVRDLDHPWHPATVGQADGGARLRRQLQTAFRRSSFIVFTFPPVVNVSVQGFTIWPSSAVIPSSTSTRTC